MRAYPIRRAIADHLIALNTLIMIVRASSKESDLSFYLYPSVRFLDLSLHSIGTLLRLHSKFPTLAFSKALSLLVKISRMPTDANPI